MIRTRFNLIYTLSDMVPGARSGVLLQYADLLQVPDLNEVVNIKGNPYRVFCRGWSIPEQDEVGGDGVVRRSDPYTQYAYVEVQKAADFTVWVAGKEY